MEIQASCAKAAPTLDIGRGSQSDLVDKTGYLYQGGAWQPFTLTSASPLQYTYLVWRLCLRSSSLLIRHHLLVLCRRLRLLLVRYCLEVRLCRCRLCYRWLADPGLRASNRWDDRDDRDGRNYGDHRRDEWRHHGCFGGPHRWGYTSCTCRRSRRWVYHARAQ
jgi:hypothetical protein